MKKILVVAPHPDDETLGCGGVILKHIANGDEVHWLIVTNISKEYGWSSKDVNIRATEIEKVSKMYKFHQVHCFSLPTTRLDEINYSELVSMFTKVLNLIKPSNIYMPYRFDVHTDHQITAKAIQSSIKPFRTPFVQRVLMYETLSETGLNYVEGKSFSPNVFINIDKYIDLKLEIMSVYESELGEHPFPRSKKAIKALSILRGSQSNNEDAESFELVYESIK